jgi:hypothetical protein
MKTKVFLWHPRHKFYDFSLRLCILWFCLNLPPSVPPLLKCVLFMFMKCKQTIIQTKQTYHTISNTCTDVPIKFQINRTLNSGEILSFLKPRFSQFWQVFCSFACLQYEKQSNLETKACTLIWNTNEVSAQSDCARLRNSNFCLSRQQQTDRQTDRHRNHRKQVKL